jgi:hypothetical protein
MWLRARLLRIDRIMGLVRARTESYACKYVYVCVCSKRAQLRTAFESLMTAIGDVCVVCAPIRREKLLVVRRSERSSNYEIHTQLLANY